jgi:hypothetical protein
MKNFEGNADSRLTTSRVSVLLACANEAAFIVFLTWFLFQHADPRGDGMEMAGGRLCVHADFFAIHLARRPSIHDRTPSQPRERRAKA